MSDKLSVSILLELFYRRHAPHLTSADLAVCMFVFRRTYCFNHTCETITMNEFRLGKHDSSGNVVTAGTKLHRGTVQRSIARLKHTGLLKTQRTAAHKTEYQLDLAVSEEVLRDKLQTFAKYTGKKPIKSKRKDATVVELVVHRRDKNI